MTKIYHILNGDALFSRFPKIEGERIVARECLVDGPVLGASLEEVYQTRAQFIHQTYPENSVQTYYDQVVPEFQKILTLPEAATINLWFEDDLFCQVNCWFVLYLLNQQTAPFDVFLVRPPVHTRYGFSQFSLAELLQLYRQKITLKPLSQLAQIWPLYQQGAVDDLLAKAEQLAISYPFILTAVNAHLDRLPKPGFPGRPKRLLMDIQQKLGTTDFGAIFRAFSEQAPIYGFGDLQVKRLLLELEAT